MREYVARRLVLAIPTIFGGMTLIFLLMRIVPGDVAAMMLFSEEGGTFDEATYRHLREQLGLDRPLILQYWEWMAGALRFEMGNSLISDKPVVSELLHRLPVTLQITLMSVFVGYGLGIPLGILAAYRRDGIYDYGLRAFASLGVATPHFWVGVLVLLFGIRWFGWSPPIGFHPIWEGVGPNLKQLIWPVMIIGLGSISSISRLTRSTMLEVLGEDYVRTARAKGLSELATLMRHALRNALIPVVTVGALSVIHGLAGSVIMEQIFTIPGVGLYLIQGVTYRDYPVVQGIVFFMVVTMVLANLLTDLTYGLLDPRIRY